MGMFDALQRGLDALRQIPQSAAAGQSATRPTSPDPDWLAPRHPDLGPGLQQDQPAPELGLPEVPPQQRQGPTGRARFDQQLRTAPYQRYTPEFDDWLLSLPPSYSVTPGVGDPLTGLGAPEPDPEYDAALQAAQRAARLRKQYREQEIEDSWAKQWRRVQEAEKKGPKQPKLPTPEGLRPEVVVLGPDGQPIPQQFVVTQNGAIMPFLPEIATDLDPQVQVGMAALQSGEYVWLGDTIDRQREGMFDRTMVSDTYMSAENAVSLPYHWSPEQVVYAQEALGLDPTGFVDQQLIQRWTHIVATAAGYTQAGRRVDPLTLLEWTRNATEAAGRGRGGGGGGGGGFAVDHTQAKALLNRAMLEEAGREATEEEVAAFRGALQGAGGDVDPGQYAIDWVRSTAGGEAGTYQAATDYYSAMLAILGAQTQAEEGPR